MRHLEKHVRALATLPETDAPVVSCYVELEKGRLKNPQVFRRGLGDLKKSLTSADRQQGEEALNRVEAYLAEEVLGEARGAALFSRTGKEPFFLPLQFRVPLPDSIAVDTVPKIYHLVELKDSYHRYVVLLGTAKRVRILEVTLGAVTEQVWKDRPELRNRVGREWSKQHYSRRREEHGDRFLKDVVRFLAERMSAGGYKHLILAGEPKVLRKVRAALPKSLSDSLVDSVPASGEDKTTDVVMATLSNFVEEEQRESLSTVEALHGEVRTNGLGLSGERATLSALERGQADVLVLAKGYDSEAREAMVRLATTTGCGVEIVDQSDLLARLGGVGCLLRYRIAANTMHADEREAEGEPTQEGV
jgi:protein required for attachment to host cells